MSSETISLIAAGAAAVISIVYNIWYAIYKNKKAAELTQEAEEVTKEKTLLEILENIPSYIEKAEKIFTQSGTGSAKKAFVENLVKMDCITSGVVYDEETVTERIEEILSTPTKKSEEETKVETVQSTTNQNLYF